jgi:hypothetical protein
MSVEQILNVMNSNSSGNRAENIAIIIITSHGCMELDDENGKIKTFEIPNDMTLLKYSIAVPGSISIYLNPLLYDYLVYIQENINSFVNTIKTSVDRRYDKNYYLDHFSEPELNSKSNSSYKF